jgi:multisubunit Na+/H+ antiporter MnhG subunit
MSSFFADLCIWALLLIGAGFGGISIVGLLLFPDTSSRMFTAFRAAMIALSAVVLAVIIYGLNALKTAGGGQYLTLTIHALFLLIVLVVGTWTMNVLILDRTTPESACQSLQGMASPKNE